jgi:hypothetical protein
MTASGNEYPVIVEGEGIKLKTDKMVTDQLYHCIHDGKVFMFYKDEEGLLHCYEVQNPAATNEIIRNPSQIEDILKKHATEG